MTVEEIRANTSDQPLRHQQGSESQEYEDIILHPHQRTLELQCCNVAYSGVGMQYHHSQGVHKPKMKDKSGLQMHPEVLELQENVAYQRPSELWECSDFPVYDIVS